MAVVPKTGMDHENRSGETWAVWIAIILYIYIYIYVRVYIYIHIRTCVNGVVVGGVSDWDK